MFINKPLIKGKGNPYDKSNQNITKKIPNNLSS